MRLSTFEVCSRSVLWQRTIRNGLRDRRCSEPPLWPRDTASFQFPPCPRLLLPIQDHNWDPTFVSLRWEQITSRFCFRRRGGAEVSVRSAKGSNSMLSTAEEGRGKSSFSVILSGPMESWICWRKYMSRLKGRKNGETVTSQIWLHMRWNGSWDETAHDARVPYHRF